jgi:hypothetical protein
VENFHALKRESDVFSWNMPIIIKTHIGIGIAAISPKAHQKILPPLNGGQTPLFAIPTFDKDFSEILSSLVEEFCDAKDGKPKPNGRKHGKQIEPYTPSESMSTNSRNLINHFFNLLFFFCLYYSPFGKKSQ